jgi:hypothetical protein
MQKIMRKYLKILEIELEDLQSDIELLINEYNARKDRGEITDYVLLENLAVLKNEICAIHAFHEMVEDLEMDSYKNLESFIRDVKDRFKGRIRECSLAEGIEQYVERKLDKVFKYVTHN